MKHLKIYENYKDKIKSKYQFNDFITKYTPGYYMIFKSNMYSWKYNKKNDYLALCRIMVPELFDEGMRLKIDIMSYICELDQDGIREIEKIKTGETLINQTHETFKKIFISSSLKDTQDKFEELKNSDYYYQWELNREANKFNI